jgi:TolB-like protein
MDEPSTLPVAKDAPKRGVRWVALLTRFKRPLVAVAGVGAVLSGLAGWWNAYNTVRSAAGAAPASSTTQAQKHLQADPLSVVVLPFANQTGDAQKAYIADGLTSGLTTDLARIRDAYVVPATTAFVYRDKGLTVQQIGQALGVGYVLGGSVISGAAKLRVTAQLADARTGAQLWSRSFDGDMAELLTLQDQIVSEMETSTGNSMVLNAAQQSERHRGNPTAVDFKLRARALNLQPQSEDNLKRSQALLRQALALEPENASTKLELAGTLWVLANNWEHGIALTEQRNQQLAEARRLATDASAALPDNVQACRLMGSFSRLDGELDASRRIIERCLNLSPRSPTLLNDLAMLSMYDGADGARQSVDLLRKAVDIEGTHVREMTQMNLGEAMFSAGDSAGAVTQLQLALRANPRIVEAYWYLAMAYADLGDTRHLEEVKAKIANPNEPAHELHGVRFKDFEVSNSVDTPGYRMLRETRFLPLWRKAGFPL